MNVLHLARASFALVFFLASNQLVAQTTGLARLSQSKGFKFGFLVSPENIAEDAFADNVIAEASVGTITTYWHLPGDVGMPGDIGLNRGPNATNTNPASPRGRYDFSRPNSVVDFCIEHGKEIHGHPLLWPKDQFTPPWVFEIPAEHARATLANHVRRVVSEYRGRISTWHVVNEAFDYTGVLNDSYWARTLGTPFPRAVAPAYMDIAFRAAANADPNARLIYNDYGQEEADPRKFNAIRNALVDMRRRGIPVHGMGWQLHQTVSTVLSPNFKLEERMNEMAALGFDNYITELDIVMDERKIDGSLEDPKQAYTAEDYRRQKWAYKKVFEIFSRVKRRVAAQVWGVSDKESWLGADRQPLLFDRNFEKKPAYDGVREALIGEISGIRTLRIICSNSYLSPGETQNASSPAQLLVASNRQPVTIPQWEVLPAELFAAYRMRSMSSDRCLAPLQNRWFGAVGTQPLALNERNQQWYLFPVGNNHFLVFNTQSFLLLQQNFQRRTSTPVTVGPLFSLFLGIWKIE